ncbi:hypothetical protein DL96DRAFT_1617827 [Flagelloscypha sp. PMI_526]|nr:hypothetical protein DL96DRAFT_1617827 [Flagelloscypha sp. PMI_526]
MALSCIKNAQDLITCLPESGVLFRALPLIFSSQFAATLERMRSQTRRITTLFHPIWNRPSTCTTVFYPYKDSSLTGWAFETIVNHILSHSLNTHTTRTFDDQHLFLSGADDGTGFIMTRKAEELFPRLSIKPVYVDFARLSALERALENLSSSPTNPSIPAVYLIPEDQSNSVFDSVLVEGGGCVWVIKSNLGKAHESNESDTPLLRNLHKAIRACGGDPYYRYLHVTAAEKMTATPSSNIPSFSTARNVFYLPLCWDSLNKFSSSSTFELEVLDNEQSDVGSVSL